MNITAQIMSTDLNEYTVFGTIYGIEVIVTASSREAAIEGFQAELDYFSALFEEEVTQWVPSQVAA